VAPFVCTTNINDESMHRLLFPALLLCSAFSCGGALDPEPESEGFQLLDAMLQIDIPYKAIEPNFRNRQAFESNATAAQEILTWADDPTFAEFVEGDRFYSEADAFYAMRDDMKAGAQLVIDGAAGENVDVVRDGFIALKQSCIACHKRFSPSY